jgi:T4 bacteriophage base plate protein
MRALSASDVVYVWEVGRQKHPIDRALLLLALAFPSLSPVALSALTIGQRNIQLLLLRQSTLGPQASCFVQCPRCNEKLEFSIDLLALLPSNVATPVEPGESGERVHTLCVDAFNLSLRMPTSADLASVVGCPDEKEGRRLLIERCVVQAAKDEQAVAIENLPENVLEALTDAIIEHDPLIEMEFALDCPACQHSWTTLFDIVSFFWTELDALAKRLLRDVHTIASAYGWRESDILALSAARRQFYLELIR